MFLESIKQYHHNFDHYFRFFRTTIQYIASLKYTTDKARYFQLITSQLSQDELILLFYYTITSDEQFVALVDEQQILAPILSSSSLFDSWHHWLMPQTDFKFLVDAELKEKRTYRRSLESKNK